jgi:protein-tyrosine phosphatase
MIDLHCHIIPGIDDGAASVEMALDMARAFVADGVAAVACTPHILPGLYHNTGAQIREATAWLQGVLDAERIPLHLVTGADNHVVPGFVEHLRSGHLLTLGDSRYVLVEPPHHTLPARLDEFFFGIQVAGYVPILTHPERMGWIKSNYSLIQQLARTGVWMQITSGSITGAFGRGAQYWSERMLGEGLVHIIATDAHDTQRRPPVLGESRAHAARIVGDEEAYHLVVTRPQGVLANVPPSDLPEPAGRVAASLPKERQADAGDRGGDRRGVADRLRRLFDR